jgi:hypothetical protein
VWRTTVRDGAVVFSDVTCLFPIEIPCSDPPYTEVVTVDVLFAIVGGRIALVDYDPSVNEPPWFVPHRVDVLFDTFTGVPLQTTWWQILATDSHVTITVESLEILR